MHFKLNLCSWNIMHIIVKKMTMKEQKKVNKSIYRERKKGRFMVTEKKKYAIRTMLHISICVAVDFSLNELN